MAQSNLDSIHFQSWGSQSTAIVISKEVSRPFDKPLTNQAAFVAVWEPDQSDLDWETLVPVIALASLTA